MFTDAKGAVVAICFKQDVNGGMASEAFAKNKINDFNVVSWNERSAKFLVIGDVAQSELKDIADIVKLSI